MFWVVSKSNKKDIDHFNAKKNNYITTLSLRMVH